MDSCFSVFHFDSLKCKGGDVDAGGKIAAELSAGAHIFDCLHETFFPM